MDNITNDVVRETTQDWLDCFESSRARGENLADSIFWRLALYTLPECVDPDDPRVKAALEEIRCSVQKARRIE